MSIQSFSKSAIDAEFRTLDLEITHVNVTLRKLQERRKLLETEYSGLDDTVAFLAWGSGRGRLISKALICDGKPGYFCVVRCGDRRDSRDCIIFACAPDDDIIITDLNRLNKEGKIRLKSKPMKYDGNSGYFCVKTIDTGKIQRDAIVFVSSSQEDIVITDLEMKVDELGLPVPSNPPKNNRR